jgi:hypothetical protein
VSHTAATILSNGARRALVAALALLVLVTLPATASGQVVVRADVNDRRVFVGQPFPVDIVVQGASEVPAPSIPAIDGFEISYVGGADESRSSITIINGVRREFNEKSYRHRFQFIATRPGELAIPAIRVMVEGQEHLTSPTQISVTPPQKDSDVKLWLSVDNESPFVGEPVRVRLMLGLRRNGVRLAFSIPGIADNFDLIDPEPFSQRQMQTVFNILGADLPVERGTKREGEDEWATFSAERIVIPRRSGAITLGPATVDAEVETRPAETIFDRRQTRRTVVPSDPLTINVKPLPDKGRPGNFNGLVGRYSISATATPLEVGVGDPINLEIRVTGPLPGAVPEPALDRQDSLAGSFRLTTEGQSATTEGRTRIFRKTLRVAREDVSEIPPIELPYFDTKSGEYVVARSAAIPLTVRATRVITAADAQGESSSGASIAAAVEDKVGGIAFNYEGAELLADQSFDVRSVLRSPLGLAAIAGPPALYTAAGAVILLRRRAGSETSAQRRRRLLTEARAALTALSSESKPSDAAAAISSAVRKVVGARLNIRGDGLTAREAEDALVAAGMSGAAERARAILETCDAALYGGLAPERIHSLRDDAGDLIETIDRANGGAA